MQPHVSEVYFDNTTIDTGNVVSNTIHGDLEGAEVEIIVSEAFASADATLTLHLKECATVGGSYTDVLLTKALTPAQLPKSGVNPLLRFSIPKGLQAFTEIVAEVLATKSFTAGKLHAHVINRQM